MKITLTLEIERALTKHAQRKGTTPEMLALETLRERFVPALERESPGEEQGTMVTVQSSGPNTIKGTPVMIN